MLEVSNASGGFDPLHGADHVHLVPLSTIWAGIITFKALATVDLQSQAPKE